MKTTIDVDAVATNATPDKSSGFSLCLHLEGGYPVTELGTGKIGYVVWLGLDEAAEVVSRISAEIARARGSKAAT